MQGCQALGVGCVDPGLYFTLEPSLVHFVTVSHLAIGFVVLEVDPHFCQVVFEGCIMQQSRVVLVHHQAQVQVPMAL